MPIGYPGNSISKEARAKAGGGFESAIEVVAGGPLSYSAPSGLINGGDLVVNTDGSAGFDFGTQPAKQATMGFGQGALYTTSTGTHLPSNTDPLSGADWYVEQNFSQGRFVADRDGIRVIETVGPIDNPGTNVGGGFIGWDNVTDFAENEKVLFSRVSYSESDFQDSPGRDGYEWYEIQSVDSDSQITLTTTYTNTTNSNQKCVVAPNNLIETGKVEFRASVTNGSAIVTGSGFSAFSPGDAFGDYEWTQWKELRVSDRNGLGNPNDWYMLKNQNTRTGGRVESSPGGNIFGAGPFIGGISGEWYRLDNLINFGNLDTANASFKTRRVRPSQGTVDNSDWTPSGTTLHGSSFRLSWITIQDFITYTTNTVIGQTDLFIQTGSYARFELANTDHPDTTTEAYILPFKSWGSNQCTLHLWNSLFPNFTGKYLHFYDADNVFKYSVELV